MILMAGIDYTRANIAQREALSFVAGQVSTLLTDIRRHTGIAGCTLISTCNRTELYLSATTIVDPATLLCTAAGVAPERFEGIFVRRTGADAVRHLMEVSCGLRSQILGEDQIVTQVKQAAQLAREANTVDPVLATLFRCATTAGKLAKTETHLVAVPRSAAHRGIELAAQQLGGLSGRRAVVIGNGEMGRIASDLLVEQGAHVTVTLRTYRHGETIVPRGCATQPYEDRMLVIESCDLVVSATTSPHYTLTAEQVAGLSHKPMLLLDLALPRDIDPAVTGVSCLNMDDLGELGSEDTLDRARILQIIEEQIARFDEWSSYRAALPVIEELKQTAFERVWMGEGDEELMRTAVDKTIDMLLGGMKEVISPQLLKKTLLKMQKNAVSAERLRSKA